jgi:Na+/H+ antiporter NhaA
MGIRVGSRTDTWIEDMVVKPLVFVIGIYIVAATLTGFLGWSQSVFPPLFTAAGGIPALGAYYKGKLQTA